ncbi:hypothetical protein ACFSSA_06880 [Luteolibacter algae]|uniref:DUF3149 domain-containing protein n=1 Tax=Luteolibacter algae TaxID=454151 RepID=A0ABW5D6A2_9BACT
MNQEITDGGGFALVMLGMILLSFSVVGMLLFSLVKNASKASPEDLGKSGDKTEGKAEDSF